MRAEIGTVWIPRNLLERVIAEADRHYPQETGGVLLGYWDAGGREAVITNLIGPGPEAVHKRHGFIPDYAYQEARIAEHYEASGRLHTYLGDWHTHPDTAQAGLSWRDRQTLRRIASAPDARSPVPLMGVLSGRPENWMATIWKAGLRRRWNFVLGPKADPLSIMVW